MRTIILTGATGLIGETFINLFSMPRNAKLIIVTRKKPDFELPKGVEVRIISDFFDEDALCEALQGGNEMICCIGTTIKKAGSKKAFEKTDVGIIELLAQCCSELDYDGFHYVSSIDSSIASKAFYLQCKGRAEMAIQLRKFKRISILRPSLLLGKRREYRLGEKIGDFFENLPTIQFRERGVSAPIFSYYFSSLHPIRRPAFTTQLARFYTADWTTV